jgi:hypothetical protein
MILLLLQPLSANKKKQQKEKVNIWWDRTGDLI